MEEREKTIKGIKITSTQHIQQIFTHISLGATLLNKKQISQADPKAQPDTTEGNNTSVF